MKNKLIFIGLNELNLKYIEYYISIGKLPTFKKIILKYGYSETSSESEYKLLEPWIQWASIHTGKMYDEHKILRLGDIVERKDLSQIFEEVEKLGFSVGAISPFNADNRLKRPKFFVPDPWTHTAASGNNLLIKMSKAVSQAVNDNAHGRLQVSSAFSLGMGLMKYAGIKKLASYIRLLPQLKSKVGTKALILDKLLGDVFIKEWKKNQPDFSWLFLNSGAHFQHHYMFNSAAYKGDLRNPDWYCPKDQDPLLRILEVYDSILEEVTSFQNVRIMLATGLHQKPHPHMTFYWRLKEHADFLKKIGCDNYTEVLPRMSRDFLVTFSTEADARETEKLLQGFKSIKDQMDIFSIDNRGKSLFVELTYSNDIHDDFEISNGKISLVNFKSYIAFVAIKNGEHDGIGYFIDSDRKVNGVDNKIKLTEVHEKLISNFTEV
jgi:hypothetical protein